jgi:nitrous oxidase accessory protein
LLPVQYVRAFVRSSALPVAAALMLALPASATRIIVSPSGPYRNIQSAIRAAKASDTVIVKKGIYTEHTITIDKRITLIGEDHPIVELQHKEEGFIITSDDVMLSGFTIRNTATGSMKDYAGIHAFHASRVTISGNTLLNTFFGIFFSDCKDGLITGNNVFGQNTGQTASGNGIQLWQCSNIAIRHNHIKAHRDGIYFEFARYCHIENNLSEQNFRYGLHFMFSDNDLYYHNDFKNNGTGVAVMYSKHINMLYNIFEDNWGDASYALLLKDIHGGLIIGNRFLRNTSAIYLEGTNEMDIKRNLFEKNGWAVKLLANCMYDTFSRNNFIANTFDVSTNGTMFNNFFRNNYWDKYEGYDLDNDRIGDVPYRPVSLYSIVIEQIPEALMLLRSFTVDIMDKAEKVIPSLIPDLLKDESPSMRRNTL